MNVILIKKPRKDIALKIYMIQLIQVIAIRITSLNSTLLDKLIRVK